VEHLDEALRVIASMNAAGVEYVVVGGDALQRAFALEEEGG
jgi:hypothetical protein